MSPRRLTYRDAVRMAPVAWLDGAELITIERVIDVGDLVAVKVRPLAPPDRVVSHVRLRRPNAAARRLLEALR